jgi:hypothetical protein
MRENYGALWKFLRVSEAIARRRSFQLKRSLNNMNKIELRRRKKGIKKF